MVSGRYRSGDIAFSWTHVMPLTEDGISSNTGAAARSPGACHVGRPAAAATPARPATRRKSRRDGTSRFDDVRFILLRDSVRPGQLTADLHMVAPAFRTPPLPQWLRAPVARRPPPTPTAYRPAPNAQRPAPAGTVLR